jgi:hypothetical protein
MLGFVEHDLDVLHVTGLIKPDTDRLRAGCSGPPDTVTGVRAASIGALASSLVTMTSASSTEIQPVSVRLRSTAPTCLRTVTPISGT